MRHIIATAAHASAAPMALYHSHPGRGWISWAAPSCCTENCAAPARSATSMIAVHTPSSTLRRVTEQNCVLRIAKKEEARTLNRAHHAIHGVCKVACGAAWAA